MSDRGPDLASERALNRPLKAKCSIPVRSVGGVIISSFYSAMTTELVLAELLCCDYECVFCNSLVFYVFAFYFILWAVVSAGYPALLSISYFERINDDDDDDLAFVSREPAGG